MNRLLCQWAGGLLLATLLLQPARAVDVRAVRLWAGPDNTRVVVDLSGTAQHSLLLLHNPERVVLDVSGAHLAKVCAQRAARRGRRQKCAHVAQSVGQFSPGARSGPAHSSEELSERAERALRLSPGCRSRASCAHRVDKPIKAKHAPSDARDLIIAIDAGHGGEDPGAIGKNGTREKDVVLAIARELALKINAEAGMKAILTRGGDYFVPLRDRMRRARAQQADLFVSIHADSIRDRSIDGSSVYILSQRGATDEASRWLAERENASDLIGGVSLDDKDDVLASVLLDLSQSASLNASQVAAERVLHQLTQAGEVRKHEVQQARFMVLKSPDIPSMLVETAYISNPQEEQRLRTPAHQAKLAAAIHQGVHDYFYANPPHGHAYRAARQRQVPRDRCSPPPAVRAARASSRP